MSNELIAFNTEELAVIKNMFCANATDMEFKLFIEMSKALGLDPKKKEIYFIKYGTGERAKPTMIVGIDGYRKIAERSGRYMPGREPSFTYKNNLLFSATAYVKKLGPDKQWHDVGATAILSEYDAGQGQWKKMPHAMLAKCAESLALRRAFPAEMSGTYTEEEMEQVDASVNKSTGEITKSVDVGSKLVGEKAPTITIAEASNIESIIGDDEEYKQRILSHYGAKYFIDIEHKHHDLILSKAKAFRDEKAKKEMETV